VRAPERPPPLPLALVLTSLLLCAPAAGAEAPEQELKSVEQALGESRDRESALNHEAEVLAAEIAELRGDSVAAAKATQEHETALSALEETLTGLAAAEAAKLKDLARHRAQQLQLLMALERLARNPPEGLALAPGDPVDVMRSAALIGAAVPPIEYEAQALSRDLAALAGLRGEIAEAQAHHRAERQSLEQERTRLAALIARKSAIQRQAQAGAEQSSQRQVLLATQAADLQQLIARLEVERKAREAREAREAEVQRRREEAARHREEVAHQRAEAQRREAERLARLAPPPAPTAPEAPSPAAPDTAVTVTAPAPVLVDPARPKLLRSFAKARGLVVYPASGKLLLQFGESDELGVVSKGITVETRAGAQVIAPFDGKIAFAGAFRGYGQILIIEHGDGYHSLVAGLDRIDGTVGQWLVAGEPVGTMPRGEERPHLYLELRHDGQPINPMPWLATRDEKVSG
jgi:murein hydrolase activator